MKAAKLIIVSGGFAGITLADHLNRRFARDVEAVVISSENHMVFTPMLAEVAGRSLSGLDVVLPGRQIAPRPTWLTATVTGVDLEKNELEYTHRTESQRQSGREHPVVMRVKQPSVQFTLLVGGVVNALSSRRR